jgi:hypothetical protein
MRRFIETSLVDDPDRPTTERLAAYDKLFADHGPLHVSALETVTPLEFHLMGQSRRGGVHIIVRASEQQTGRAASVTLRFEGAQP